MAFDERNIQIIKYLDKNYCIKEDLFFTIYDDSHEWGAPLTRGLATIFSFDKDFCRDVLMHWAYEKGMSSEIFEKAWWNHKLQTTWSPEMAQDLQNLYGVGDAEAQLTAILSERIAAEIDSQILRDLMGLGKTTTEEFISVVKCVGYEPTELTYDQFTGKPRKGFKSMNYNDIRNERESNHIWQNYIRPTRIDDKA
jgi:hypothetical protein